MTTKITPFNGALSSQKLLNVDDIFTEDIGTKNKSLTIFDRKRRKMAKKHRIL